MTTDVAPAEPSSLASSLDRARALDEPLRERRRLRPAEHATGPEIERDIDRHALTPAADDELTALATAAQGGDDTARERLVAEMLPTIVGAARRYAGRDIELSDLVQEAVLGLLRALGRFEPSRGVPFPAYARWWVRQALQQAVAEQSRSVRLPTNVLWDLHALKEAREAYVRESGGEPTPAELAGRLGWRGRRVEDALGAEARPLSLDQPGRGEEGDVVAAGELLVDPLAADEYERIIDAVTAPAMRALLSTLTDRERQVLAWRLGLEGEPQSLRQVGRALGISGERVRAIEGRALAKLRTAALAGAAKGEADGRTA
jgi:RNA polymerase sigma factor (sigma-70 family)